MKTCTHFLTFPQHVFCVLQYLACKDELLRCWQHMGPEVCPTCKTSARWPIQIQGQSGGTQVSLCMPQYCTGLQAVHRPHLAGHKVASKDQLLRNWQDQRRQAGDICLESHCSNAHQLPPNLDAYLALVILLLNHHTAHTICSLGSASLICSKVLTQQSHTEAACRHPHCCPCVSRPHAIACVWPNSSSCVCGGHPR